MIHEEEFIYKNNIITNDLPNPNVNCSNFSQTPSSGKIFYDRNHEDYDFLDEISQGDYPNIKVIQGNFTMYYDEKEMLGQGASSTVKKCHKLNDPSQLHAVKICSYKGDLELLQMVS